MTNYKGMAASTRNSLIMAVESEGLPHLALRHTALSTSGWRRCFPERDCGSLMFRTARRITIITIETMDDTASRWTVGKEATLVGLPQSSSPTGTTPQPPYNLLCAAWF